MVDDEELAIMFLRNSVKACFVKDDNCKGNVLIEYNRNKGR